MDVSWHRDNLWDVPCIVIVKGGIVREGKCGVVYCGRGTDPQGKWVIGTGMKTCANMTCKETSKSHTWEIWSGSRKGILDPNLIQGVLEW